MVSLSVARSANAAFSAAYRPVALFVGGTSGIGQATAQAFARATKGNAHIMICGRNKASAEDTIASFPQTSDSKYEFISCDVTLMKNVVTAAESIKSRVDTVNYLVLSQGVLDFNGFTPTAEGIDRKFALRFYSRWKFVDELLPLLQNANRQGQEARIMSVLDPTSASALQENDLGLKKNYGFVSCATQSGTYNNIMVEEYSVRYPGLSFTHIFPGLVNTPLLGFHWSLRLVAPILGLFASSPQDCGEIMLSALVSPAYRQGGFYLDNHAEPLPAKKRVTASDEGRKLFVEHYKSETSTA
jgi:NAD(P)-dependent dehydrogenase (short-subunit alcohol dehydrogenase family)